MRPYDRLAPYFGAIFPCSREHQACYGRLLPEAQGRVVLDIGFGTGEHLAHLAARGANIHGLEVEAELVDWAKRRFPAFAGQLRLGSMAQAAAAFAPQRFDLALLVGNTLPHAADLAKARETLCQMARATDPEGWAVVSTVNYDRVLSQRVTSLPTLKGRTEDGRAWEFRRSYDLSEAPQRVIFHTRLMTADETIEGRHALLPITRDELASAAEAAFGEAEVFGGYMEEAWSLDTFGTVVVACRPREVVGG